MNGTLVCHDCGATPDPGGFPWRCACGGLLDLRWSSRFPRDAIRSRPPGLWRYAEAIPADPARGLVTWGEGFTPLVPVSVGESRVLLKLEFLFPSGSFKDRGASVLISHLRALGATKLVEDSSGNAGAAIAAYAARAGIPAEIYVPASTSADKLHQIEAHGAALVRVPGTREETAAAALAAAAAAPYASHIYHPYFFHGTKTFAFEVWEQLGFRAPDSVVLPVGHGTLFLGAYYGFRELREAGEIERLPRLIGVQAAACAPLVEAFRTRAERLPGVPVAETAAEGIRIADPPRWRQILAATEESRGMLVAVSEARIVKALRWLARLGLYVEPTAAAAVGALEDLTSCFFLGGRETVVVPLTGSGLKAGQKVATLVR
jgi:threonine synthase